MKKRQILILGLIAVFFIRMAMEMRPGQFLMVFLPIMAIAYVIAWKKGVFRKDEWELE